MAAVGRASDLPSGGVGATEGGHLAVQRILRGVRERLGLDVAFVSQFLGGDRVFRYVDSGAGGSPVKVGDGDPLEDSYCQRVVNGTLPEFLADAGQHPVAARLPVTSSLPVGTHLSVPIRFSDGRIYGTFCCFSRSVQPSVDERDVTTLHLLSELVAEYLEAVDGQERDRQRRRDRIAELVADPASINMVFQPLFDLASGRAVGLEALARFPTVGEGPERVFSEAWAVGLGVELEVKAVRAALAALDQLSERWMLGVNVAPTTLVSAAFSEAVQSVPAGRLIVEVTEHAAVDDYDELTAAAQRLSSLGIGLAIDDVGMGFSGLNHILESSPDAIKIDAAVVREVDVRPAKRAMIEALVSFGAQVGVMVIAEGIETASELETLRELGVPIGQGYHLARPAELSAVIRYGAH